jgi:hypothetical protein
MIWNESDTAPRFVVSAAFPGSPTVTHWIASPLAIEPNGRQASAASQRESGLTEGRIMEVAFVTL